MTDQEESGNSSDMARFFRLSASLLALLLVVGTASSAEAAKVLPQDYHHAFDLLDQGKVEQAYIYAAKGKDRVLNKVLFGAYMAHPGNDVSFQIMQSFIAQEPDWPNLRAIVQIAEQKLPPDASYDDVIRWFSDHPPISVTSFYRYVDALNAMGQSQKAEAAIRDRWTNAEFSADELTAFYGRFSIFLTREDVWARLDRLLWKNDAQGVGHVLPYCDTGMRDVAEARLAIANQSMNARALLDRVPSNWDNTPGLLFERLRWDRKNNLNDAALEILENPPQNLGNPDAWWEERPDHDPTANGRERL